MKRMSHISVFFAFFLLATSTAGISSLHLRCANGIGKAYYENICDGYRNCNDGSDENSNLCRLWNQGSCSSNGQFRCEYGCHWLRDACTTFCPEMPSQLCEMYHQNKIILTKLTTEKPATEKPVEILESPVKDQLSDAVNSTLSEPDCPMLYASVAGRCLSIFYPAQITWPEASEFCHSIFGELVYLSNVSEYANLQQHLQDISSFSDYWIGGRYVMESNKWLWVNEAPMPMGSPYWSVLYSSSCKTRKTPDGTQSSGCYNYHLAPVESEIGLCASMPYEVFYYIKEEKCTEKKVPICVFTGVKILK